VGVGVWGGPLCALLLYGEALSVHCCDSHLHCAALGGTAPPAPPLGARVLEGAVGEGRTARIATGMAVTARLKHRYRLLVPRLITDRLPRAAGSGAWPSTPPGSNTARPRSVASRSSPSPPAPPAAPT
jgi:hypothetical protein